MHTHQTHQQVLAKALRNPQFQGVWEAGKIQREITKSIIRERLKKELTQAEFAQKIGLKQSSLARVEGGNYMPSIVTLTKIAKALGKSLDVKFV